MVTPVGATSAAESGKTWVLAALERRSGWFLAAACVLFLLQTLTFFQSRWVEDESWYSAVGHTLAYEGHIRNPLFGDQDRDSHVDVRPPGTAVTLATAFRLFGTGVWQARLLFLLSALGALIATYFIALELTTPWIAALAAVAAATDNLLFLAGRTVRPDSLVLFWGTLSILLFLRSQRKKSAGLALAAGLSLGVAMDCHPNALAALASVAVFTLIEFRYRFLVEARFWALVVGFIAGLAPFLLWINSSSMNREAFVYMYTNGQGPSLKDIPSIEKIRYSDFVGFSNQRVGIKGAIPYRIHIAGAILAAAMILFARNRRLFWRLMVLLLPCPLIWAVQRHPTTRYMVIAAPWFAVLLAAAAVHLGQMNGIWRKLAIAGFVAVVGSQFGGNGLLLYTFRKANYQALTAQLRSQIPSGEGVFGAITFWMALHDHPFTSWNRTTVEDAVNRRNDSYLILNDRVLVNGSGFFGDDWEKERTAANIFAQQHATLVGRAPDAFYGDLEIYHVNTAALGH